MNMLRAMEIAKLHLQNYPAPGPNFVWTVTAPNETEEEWQFNYTFSQSSMKTNEELPGLGGPPGFAVSKKTGVVREMKWDEFK